MNKTFFTRTKTSRPGTVALGIATITCLALSACSGGGTSSSTGGDDKVVIGQSLPTLDNPWYAAFSEGSKDMAEALGAELNLVTNPATNAYDPSAQLNAIENLIAKRPDVIQIDPTSTDGINGAIEEARNQGIPVITDGIYVSTEVDASVVADNKQGGELAGKFVAETLKSGGNVAVLEGTPGRDIIQQRQDGFKAGISANAGAKIVASQIANLSREEGQTVAENILQANPQLGAMWGASDTMALGALEALKSRSMQGKVVLGGFDGTPEAFQAIKDGDMSFTIDQVPYEMGAVSIALAYLKATEGQFEQKTILETKLVSSENVDDYLSNEEAKRKETLDSVLKKYNLQAK
ncbi:sugar ABC transporter substrate-binding protein [Pseudarthrobacter oxydans]|uniref:sugar ABC transporter substrate-binding protein n=1 Tax=Pseudarthrobacter oxydans TaxID=1671 RepID=UPI00343E309E